jgi:hypothetical protein
LGWLYATAVFVMGSRALDRYGRRRRSETEAAAAG